jgi:hypothetical protein
MPQRYGTVQFAPSPFYLPTYNPLIFDFMVAARGYGMADAFLLMAIAVPVWHRVMGWPSLRLSCAAASLALGLSFSASFSFAFVDIAAFLAIVIWARKDGARDSRLMGYCAVPGLLVAILMCGYPLTHWPSGAFWQSARSLREMMTSLAEASLYQPNPRLLEPFNTVIHYGESWLLPAVGVFCICQLIVTRLEGSWLQDERTRWLGRFAATLAGITTLSVSMSWLAFRFAKVPLPLGRTGIYLVPLCTLLAGAIAAAPVRSVVSDWLRQGITGVFICVACYFLLCIAADLFQRI